MEYTFKRMSPDLWDDLVALFGPDGASDGCWCMSWRSKEHVEGEAAKVQLKELVAANRVRGVLAYIGDTPVGWCSYGPRCDFPQAEAHLGEGSSSHPAWSVPCFFVHADHRGCGIGSLLLEQAIQAIQESTGRLAEGFPMDPNVPDKEAHADWSFTGTFGMFHKAGFADSGQRMNVYGGSSECQLLCMNCNLS